KTEQSEIRNYEEIEQVSKVQNEKKHGLLVKSEKEVVQEQLLKNEEEDNKQNISFQKEKKIYEECKERQGADDNRIFELKRRSTWKAKTVNK
ncbi:41571_t:CDS:2, partial [Gigaspora margarita]